MENVLEQKNQKKLEDTLQNILKTSSTDLIGGTTNFLNKHFYSNNELKNIKMYCNNKIIEISNKFKRCDVPMFDKSDKEDEFVESKVGMAVVHALTTYLGQGAKLLEENERLQNPGNQMIKYEEPQGVFGKIKGILGKIKKFITRKDDKNSLGDIAVQIRNNTLKYDEICNKICDYNLKENLIDSVKDDLNHMYGEEFNKTQILENEIIPDFKKLGLSNKINELKEKVIGKQNSLEQYKVDYVFDICIKTESNKEINNDREIEIGD
ncbi:MAG: DUF4007 family protein [Clostridia bacterium]|nr:DUF4007 family protein [Clostridia bacterium]